MRPGPRATAALPVLAAVLSLFGPTPAAAQAADPHAAQPERPTVSTHAGTVAPGWVEVEAGIEADRYDDAAHGDLGPLAVKIGLAPRLQLTVQDSVVRAPGSHATGWGDLGLGVKWRIAGQVPLLGDVAVLPAIKLPTGAVEQGQGTGTTDLSLLLISSHAFGPVAVDVNYGFIRRTGDSSVAPRHAQVWAAAAGGPVRGRLGWTSELFGFPATSGPAGMNRIIGVIEGTTFQLRRWIVLDAGFALPLAGAQPHALFAGAVYNLGHLGP